MSHTHTHILKDGFKNNKINDKPQCTMQLHIFIMIHIVL